MAQYTVFGKQYRVLDTAANFSEQGTASWYGAKFHGRKTSSGEIYDMFAMTAAHKHLPLPTFVLVTNLENAKQVIVKVNDRGPFVGTRIIDLSLAAAQQIGMEEQGTAPVRIEALSTHHVAENALPIDAEQVAGNAANSDQPNEAELATTQLAAVPLPEIPTKRSVASSIEATKQTSSALAENTTTASANAVQVVPDASAIEVFVDGSEDGFVELTGLAAGQTSYDAEAEPDAITSDSYFIQLGAFSHAPNAHSLVENVTAHIGLPAYVEQDATRTMFRVKMGPFKNDQLLNKTLVELAEVGIDGYTLRVNPR